MREQGEQKLVKQKPLSAQVYDVLNQMIMDMKPDQNKLPSEDDLARQLGVSRATVREALKYLMLDRVTTSIHGRGTFAHPSVLRLENRIDQYSDFGQMMRKHYKNVRVDVKWEYTEQSGALFQRLFQDASSMHTWWIYVADGLKRLYCNYFLDKEAFIHPLEESLPIQSLPQLSKGYMRESIDYCSMFCTIKTSDAACAQLDLPAGTPLICWEEILYDVGDRPVGTGEVYVHPENMVMSMVTRFEW